MGGWGIQPSEFWGMDAEEWWWLYDVKRQRDPAVDYAGRLDEATVAELSAWLDEEG